MKLIRSAIGCEAIIAEGDINDADDRVRLAEAFQAQIAAGMFAVVPMARLDACCRRGLVIEQFSDVPANAGSVAFLRRPTSDS